mmetsp:Transcript_7355/g.9179  ORF Transcript_7355/g.9179 Transcript_7355/m.9179 type:complete len:126 (+) Transcript_7355:3-380(+)
MVLSMTDTVEDVIQRVCQRRQYLNPPQMRKWTAALVSRTQNVVVQVPTMEQEKKYKASVPSDDMSMLYAFLMSRNKHIVGKDPTDLINGPLLLGFHKPYPTPTPSSQSSGRSVRRHNSGMVIRGS